MIFHTNTDFKDEVNRKNVLRIRLAPSIVEMSEFIVIEVSGVWDRWRCDRMDFLSKIISLIMLTLQIFFKVSGEW